MKLRWKRALAALWLVLYGKPKKFVETTSVWGFSWSVTSVFHQWRQLLYVTLVLVAGATAVFLIPRLQLWLQKMIDGNTGVEVDTLELYLILAVGLFALCEGLNQLVSAMRDPMEDRVIRAVEIHLLAKSVGHLFDGRGEGVNSQPIERFSEIFYQVGLRTTKLFTQILFLGILGTVYLIITVQTTHSAWIILFYLLLGLSFWTFRRVFESMYNGFRLMIEVYGRIRDRLQQVDELRLNGTLEKAKMQTQQELETADHHWKQVSARKIAGGLWPTVAMLSVVPILLITSLRTGMSVLEALIPVVYAKQAIVHYGQVMEGIGDFFRGVPHYQELTRIRSEPKFATGDRHPPADETLTVGMNDVLYAPREAVLDQVTFELQPGMYGVVGSSGAGKSTMFSLFLQRIDPDQGEVLWCRRPVQEYNVSIFRRMIRVAQIQGTGLVKGRTIAENLAWVFGGEFSSDGEAIHITPHKIPPDNVQLARESLDKFGLENLSLEDKIGENFPSGGERQRLMDAAMWYRLQCLKRDSLPPLLFLLDEPTGGVDPAFKAPIFELLAEIIEGDGRHIGLVITHDVRDLKKGVCTFRRKAGGEDDTVKALIVENGKVRKGIL